MRAKTPYNKKRKRLARGPGSGHGKTAGRGHKGQKSRSGSSLRPGFEGGQNPLYRRLPKRGFSNAAFSKEYRIINLSFLNEFGEKEVSPETLTAKGVIKNFKSGLKVLGTGEIKTAIVVKAHAFSATAKDKILKAGGQAILINASENE